MLLVKALKSIAEKSPTTAKFLEGIQNELLERIQMQILNGLKEQSRKAIMSMASIISPEDFVEHQRQTKAEGCSWRTLIGTIISAKANNVKCNISSQPLIVVL